MDKVLIKKMFNFYKERRKIFVSFDELQAHIKIIWLWLFSILFIITAPILKPTIQIIDILIDALRVLKKAKKKENLDFIMKQLEKY